MSQKPAKHFTWKLVASLIIVLLSAVIYLGNTYRFQLERWDDAYITFRFAEHLANGNGLIWNIGGDRVEGFTSMFHVLLIAAGFKAGIDPWLSSLILGVIAVLLTAVIMTAVLWKQFGTLHPVAAVMTGIYLIDVNTAIHTTSGLETQLFVVFLFGVYFSSFLFIKNAGWPSAFYLGSLVFLSCLTRPEGVIYGFVTYLVLIISCFWLAENSSALKNRLVKLAASGSFLLLTGMVYAAWKYSYFGYLLPNPFYVKSNGYGFNGISEVTEFVKHLVKWFAPLVLAIIALSLLLWRNHSLKSIGTIDSTAGQPRFWPDRRVFTLILLALAPALAALAFYATITHEVGGAYRFSYPTYGLLILALAIWMSSILTSIKWNNTFQIGVIAISLLWMGSLLYSQRNWQFALVPVGPYNLYHSKIAAALLTTGIGSRGTILCDGAGIIPYVSKFNQLDRVGLTDNVMSGRIPLTDAEREKYIWSRPIDVYIGFEPPAFAGTQNEQEDPQMKTLYVSKTLLQRKLKLIESRIMLQDPQLLHARMRELRDNWYLVGEIDFPDADGLKSFAYVRKDSPYAASLISSLTSIVKFKPDQINLNNAD